VPAVNPDLRAPIVWMIGKSGPRSRNSRYVDD